MLSRPNDVGSCSSGNYIHAHHHNNTTAIELSGERAGHAKEIYRFPGRCPKTLSRASPVTAADGVQLRAMRCERTTGLIAAATRIITVWDAHY